MKAPASSGVFKMSRTVALWLETRSQEWRSVCKAALPSASLQEVTRDLQVATVVRKKEPQPWAVRGSHKEGSRTPGSAHLTMPGATLP